MAKRNIRKAAGLYKDVAPVARISGYLASGIVQGGGVQSDNKPPLSLPNLTHMHFART